MRNVTVCVLFLLALSTARADDIATIKTYLADKTDDQQVLHEVYMACLNLTRTGTEEAVPVLKQLLEVEQFRTVARTALVNIQGEEAGPSLKELSQDAARLAVLVQNERGLIEAFKVNSTIPFRITLRAVLERKWNDTSIIVLDNMGNLPVWQQAALIRNLGARKDSVAIVPKLIELATGDQPELQVAAVEALGEIGDLRAVDTLLHLAGTPVGETADSGRGFSQCHNRKPQMFRGRGIRHENCCTAR
jgi:HEAT repeat protein